MSDLDRLLHTVGLIADVAASDAFRKGETSVQVTAAGVEAAFRAAVSLGLVSINDPAGWPEMIPLTGWEEA